MNDRAELFWNKYREEEEFKQNLRVKIEELEAELSYHEKLSELFYQEYDREIMRNND